MADLEEQKKLLLPILQRAEEIHAMEPRMAYYCRLYAIKKGLEIPKPAKEISGLIRATFAQCEKDKPHVRPNEEEDRVYCENFALSVFRRADKVDRAGRADMNTCKAYYAAAIFMQVCEQFLKPGEELEEAAPDIVEKTRYALWRAAEIRKALREGRQPAAPPDATSTMQSATAAGRSAAAGDMFAGPAYEQSLPDQQMTQQVPPFPGQLATDSVTSSTDDFLSLPKPPSTVPPEGSTGLLAPAAAAGPRYRPGSRVWCVTGSGLGTPEEGTVGMVLSPAGGPGGQAVYKVALRDRLKELSDSQLAPAVAAGARVLYVASYGEQPEAASVIAVNAEQWPCTYLLQLDNGSNLDTDGGHISQAAPGDARGRASPAQQQGAYPTVGSMTGTLPPVAPPLVDSHTPAAPSPAAAAAPPPKQQAAAPPAAHVAPPPQQPAADAHGYPIYPEVGAHGHSSGGGQQPGSPYSGRAPAAAGHTQHPPAHPTSTQHRAAAPHAQAPPAGAAPAYQMPVVQQSSDFKPSSSAVAEAQKYAKYAASSLAFDDVAGGIKYLTDALRLLTQPPAK